MKQCWFKSVSVHLRLHELPPKLCDLIENLSLQTLINVHDSHFWIPRVLCKSSLQLILLHMEIYCLCDNRTWTSQFLLSSKASQFNLFFCKLFQLIFRDLVPWRWNCSWTLNYNLSNCWWNFYRVLLIKIVGLLLIIHFQQLAAADENWHCNKKLSAISTRKWRFLIRSG